MRDGDLIAMLMSQPQQNNMGAQRRTQQQRQQQGQGQQRGRGGPYTTQDIENVRQNILANPPAMEQVRRDRPALADSIHDQARFLEAWRGMERAEADLEQERLEQIRLLNDDPFNIEAQAKIEEIIRKEAVQENLQFAYEHNPEGLASFHMLLNVIQLNLFPSLRSRYHALYSSPSQQASGQGIRRFRCPDDYHVTFVRRSLWHHAPD